MFPSEDAEEYYVESSDENSEFEGQSLEPNLDDSMSSVMSSNGYT